MNTLPGVMSRVAARQLAYKDLQAGETIAREDAIRLRKGESYRKEIERLEGALLLKVIEQREKYMGLVDQARGVTVQLLKEGESERIKLDAAKEILDRAGVSANWKPSREEAERAQGQVSLSMLITKGDVETIRLIEQLTERLMSGGGNGESETEVPGFGGEAD